MPALAAPPRATPKPARIIHEAQPAELGADADGVEVRTSRGRVRPSNPVESLYLFGLMRWGEYEPPLEEGFVRERIWLSPDGVWCGYTAVDRATARERK
jgi:hypothetical protein